MEAKRNSELVKASIIINIGDGIEVSCPLKIKKNMDQKTFNKRCADNKWVLIGFGFAALFMIVVLMILWRGGVIL